MGCHSVTGCWSSSDPQWVGKASMSERHRFMTVRDLDWHLFNVLTMGIRNQGDLRRAIALLEDMLAVAQDFVKADGWSENVGFFFHVFPTNSVPSLHLHLVDLDAAGPTYHAVSLPTAPPCTPRAYPFACPRSCAGRTCEQKTS